MSKTEHAPASIILEKARQQYPKHGFVIFAQGPDNKVDITTNFEPEDLKEFLTEAMGIVMNSEPKRERIPKI